LPAPATLYVYVYTGPSYRQKAIGLIQKTMDNLKLQAEKTGCAEGLQPTHVKIPRATETTRVAQCVLIDTG